MQIPRGSFLDTLLKEAQGGDQCFTHIPQATLMEPGHRPTKMTFLCVMQLLLMTLNNVTLGTPVHSCLPFGCCLLRAFLQQTNAYEP